MIASILLLLHLAGLAAAEHIVPLLFIAGVLLIVTEFMTGTFGILAVNGLLAMMVGYILQTGNNNALGFPLDWGLLFGVSFFEFLLLVGLFFAVRRTNRGKQETGTESMIGGRAEIVEWEGKSGRVRIQGEIWKAVSGNVLDIGEGKNVIVESVNDLELTVVSDTKEGE